VRARGHRLGESAKKLRTEPASLHIGQQVDVKFGLIGAAKIRPHGIRIEAAFKQFTLALWPQLRAAETLAQHRHPVVAPPVHKGSNIGDTHDVSTDA